MIKPKMEMGIEAKNSVFSLAVNDQYIIYVLYKYCHAENVAHNQCLLEFTDAKAHLVLLN